MILLNNLMVRYINEINVIEKMKKVGAVIGGEGSGGVILPEVHYGRDSLVGIALILNELAEYGGKVSDYKTSLPQYYILKTKIPLQDPQNEEDGLRIDFEDSWVNFRKSNTEPIIRIITEAKTKKEAEHLQNKIQEDLNFE